MKNSRRWTEFGLVVVLIAAAITLPVDRALELLASTFLKLLVLFERAAA